MSSPADADGSALSCCGESVAAAIALAVVSGHADDAAALAPTPLRSPLDAPRRPERSTADRRRDPRACASLRTRESALGLAADRRRAEWSRLGCVGDDGAQDPVPGWRRSGRVAIRTFLAGLPAGTGNT